MKIAVLAAALLLGCGGAAAPATAKKDASAPANEARARVREFKRAFEAAMARDNRDRAGPHVAPLLSARVPELNELALQRDLDGEVRDELLTVLAETQHPAAGPSLAAAIGAYRPDGGAPGRHDETMNAVVLAVGNMKLASASAPLFKLFERLHAASPKGQHRSFYRSVHDAMLAIRDKSWTPALIRRLDQPIESLQPRHARAVIDQVFWQATAAELLGEMRSREAVDALIRVVMSPLKANVHTTAFSALIKIGRPAAERGERVLDGQDAELAKYAEGEYLRAARDAGSPLTTDITRAAKQAPSDMATLLLSNLGRRESVAPLLRALDKGDARTKALIAGELHKLPPSPETLAAFKKTWESTDVALELPFAKAKVHLTQVVDRWFDTELALWVAKRALDLRGPDAADVQKAALEVMLKFGKKSDWAIVDKLAKTTTEYDEELGLARDAVDQCADLDCWLGLLTAPANQRKPRAFVAIKAAFMAAAIGGPSAKARLADAVPRIDNPAARFVTVSAIDRFSPDGDPALAAKFERLSDKALTPMIYRLRSRAE